ncbi:MAG: Rha family transcriptional regulator [Lachnospiraceae bacterium]|nr:Rha family transcriptional regulator [Lachnospiraceae bacterium]
MDKLEFTLDSREVAAMVGKEHHKLLRDIRTYIEQVEEINKKAFEEGKAQSNIGLVDFFQEFSYLDTKGESRPCYLVTRKGCEFIAHKLTGIKGTEFTIRYINRFHEMEAAQRTNQNFYRVKDTSLGDIAKFVREMDKVMRDQNSHPSDIAEAFYGVCEQFGIRLPDNFVKEPSIQEPEYYDERDRFYTLEELGIE